MLFRPVFFAMCLAFVVCSGVVAQDRSLAPAGLKSLTLNSLRDGTWLDRLLTHKEMRSLVRLSPPDLVDVCSLKRKPITRDGSVFRMSEEACLKFTRYTAGESFASRQTEQLRTTPGDTYWSATGNLK